MRLPKTRNDDFEGAETVTRIRVFHHNNPRQAMVSGYCPGDAVTEVFRYESRNTDGHPLPHAYDLCNVGDDPEFCDPPDSRAVDYRRRKNRSLSVGDVVAIADGDGERWYAVASVGFDTLDTPPVVRGQQRFGTTPYDAREVMQA